MAMLYRLATEGDATHHAPVLFPEHKIDDSMDIHHQAAMRLYDSGGKIFFDSLDSVAEILREVYEPMLHEKLERAAYRAVVKARQFDDKLTSYDWLRAAILKEE
jgi:hypothetical protein